VRDELDRGALSGPADQHWRGENQDGAVVDREERVVDPLARRQLAAHVFLDEVRERDEHLDHQGGDQQHGEYAVHLEEPQHAEHHRVDQAARGVQRQLMALRRAPGEALGQFVVIDRIECRHRDLDSDQGPE
jgi:hypothetical protein